MSADKTVLWWGRFDPGYSRNRILRRLLAELGWRVVDFQPRFSALGDWQARLRRLPRPDLVWVPCFRQRDLAAASRWARPRGVPLLFDPLISAYDKQVFERGKFPPQSHRARRLHDWERSLLRRADLVLADTRAHADYFAREFGLDPGRLKVVYVGAEAPLFHPAPLPDHADGSPIEVLFYGSFIGLQAPQVIVEAARLYQGPPVLWTLLGSGPLRAECERLAIGLSNVRFEEPIAYEKLPGRIHRADILLGVFDPGAKAGRVIPNKVFQALACGRPVITRQAAAYDGLGEVAGILFIPPGDARALADRVAACAASRAMPGARGQQASTSFERHFAPSRIAAMLESALQHIPSLNQTRPGRP